MTSCHDAESADKGVARLELLFSLPSRFLRKKCVKFSFFSFILSLGVEITLQSQSLAVCYSSPLSKLMTFSDTPLRLQQVETCLELLSYYGKGRKKKSDFCW